MPLEVVSGRNSCFRSARLLLNHRRRQETNAGEHAKVAFNDWRSQRAHNRKALGRLKAKAEDLASTRCAQRLNASRKPSWSASNRWSKAEIGAGPNNPCIAGGHAVAGPTLHAARARTHNWRGTWQHREGLNGRRCAVTHEVECAEARASGRPAPRYSRAAPRSQREAPTERLCRMRSLP